MAWKAGRVLVLAEFDSRREPIRMGEVSAMAGCHLRAMPLLLAGRGKDPLRPSG